MILVTVIQWLPRISVYGKWVGGHACLRALAITRVRMCKDMAFLVEKQRRSECAVPVYVCAWAGVLHSVPFQLPRNRE